MDDSPVTYAVISDIHANARAMAAATALIRETGADQVVVLGDLLTYGVEPGPTLDLVEEQIAAGADLVVGNHDQMYLDLAEGNTTYYERLPDWIRESIDFNFDRLEVQRFRALPWQREVTHGNLFFAHANPFGFPDWTYLNHDAVVERAGEELARRGFGWGFFGHTHRPRIRATAVGPTVANPGSIGQPRGGGATMLLVTTGSPGRGTTAQHRMLNYDTTQHLADLTASTLSRPTAQRLAAYFAGS